MTREGHKKHRFLCEDADCKATATKQDCKTCYKETRNAKA